MAERSGSTTALEAALGALAHEIDVPSRPVLADRVTSRLLADRAAQVREPLPRRALWTPRTRLVLATLALLAILAVAAGARLAIGAIEIRVVPSASPTGSPFDPNELGEPAPLDAVSASVGFDVALPAGRPPDAAFASAAGDRAAILAWRPDERSPSLPGTPWGLILVEVPSDSEEILVKQVDEFEDTDEIVFDGRPAFWIHAAHELFVVTDDGDQRFLVQGNVLIWERAGVTYRLETPLDLAGARAIARTVG